MRTSTGTASQTTAADDASDGSVNESTLGELGSEFGPGETALEEGGTDGSVTGDWSLSRGASHSTEIPGEDVSATETSTLEEPDKVDATLQIGGATTTGSAQLEPTLRPSSSTVSSSSNITVAKKEDGGSLGSSFASHFRAFDPKAVAHSVEELKRLVKVNQDVAASARVRSVFLAVVIIALGVMLVREEQYYRGLLQVVDKIQSPVEDMRKSYLSWRADSSEYRPGLKLAQEGAKPKYNIVLVPGFVTSGLELWQAGACADGYFRHRIWGSVGMMRSMFRNITCWLEVMSLDPVTGMDPPGIKLRAMQGLDAVDYFMPGYVVWAGVIRALADLGYDPDTLTCVPYDWRLSLSLMEERDTWFSKVKGSIELATRVNGRKTMILGHSWGATVILNFLYWTEAQEPGWVDRYIGVYANIGGPLLGVPKAVSALLSGEMRDTVEWGAMVNYLTDNFVSRRQRANLFRTWGSAIQMLPQGGPAVWGNASWAPDDTKEMRDQGKTYGSFFTSWTVSGLDAAFVRDHNFSVSQLIMNYLKGEGSPEAPTPTIDTLDVDEAISAVMNDAGSPFVTNANTWLGLAGKAETVKKFVEGPQKIKLKDPMKHPLPPAPGLKIVCMYGVGKPADRGYHYVYTPPDADEGPAGEKTAWKINTHVHTPELGLETGVWSAEGDGTVPLLSLGLMCQQPWRSKRLNPGGSKIVTREYKHAPTPGLLQGGPESADHVDILSNHNFIEDVLDLSVGREEEVQDRVISNIRQMADAVWSEIGEEVDPYY